MAEQVLIQFRVDKSLKQDVADIYSQLGLDLPTAFRMFMAKSKQVRGLPFDAVLPETNKQYEEMTDFADEEKEKLKQDKDLKKAISKYEEAEDLSYKLSSEMAEQIVSILKLQDTKQTAEEVRFSFVVAKMTAAKLLSRMSMFCYTEDEYLEGLKSARKLVQDELVPMLIQEEPCGECEQCKNGHRDKCIQPKTRDAYCESRFLPLIADSLIEYDAWNEILYDYNQQGEE